MREARTRRTGLSRAKREAMARPRPREPPVTTTTGRGALGSAAACLRLRTARTTRTAAPVATTAEATEATAIPAAVAVAAAARVARLSRFIWDYDASRRIEVFGGGAKGGILQAMATKRKSKGAYMISAVAEMYEIHPQTLRLYEREGLLRPSRSEGNTRLYTDEDLERLEFILSLARDMGVNMAGIAIVLQMRERMEEMNRQMQGFVDYVRTEMLTRMQQAAPQPGLVPLRRPFGVTSRETVREAGAAWAEEGQLGRCEVVLA